MKPTPQTWTAVVVLLLGLVLSVPMLLEFSPGYDLTERPLGMPTDKLDWEVHTSAQALAPINDTFAGSVEHNPFLPPKQVPRGLGRVRLPVPPPPLLRLPEPPVLPVVDGQ